MEVILSIPLMILHHQTKISDMFFKSRSAKILVLYLYLIMCSSDRAFPYSLIVLRNWVVATWISFSFCFLTFFSDCLQSILFVKKIQSVVMRMWVFELLRHVLTLVVSCLSKSKLLNYFLSNFLIDVNFW